MTRLNVILKHVGRKNNLLGSNIQEQTMIDQLAEESIDLHQTLRSYVYRPDFVSCNMVIGLIYSSVTQLEFLG